MTDIIFRQNRRYSQSRLLRELEKLLDRELVVIPQEPGDILGHSDGMVAPVPGRRAVFLNEYKGHLKRFGEKVYATLSRHSFNIIPFPVLFDKAPSRHKMVCAFGYYINFLRMEDYILLPTFGLDEDSVAREIVTRHVPGVKIIPVPCQRLSLQGGCIHCVTMEYDQNNLSR